MGGMVTGFLQGYGVSGGVIFIVPQRVVTDIENVGGQSWIFDS